MNLLCPNCQKPLSVPEQYAGQPMRCPLCQGTFTVPALPQMSAPPPPAPPPPPPPPEPRLAPSNAPDVYGVSNAGAPPGPPLPPPMPDLDLPELPPSGPSPVTGMPPPPPPHGPPPTYVEENPTYPNLPLPEGYQRRFTIWFSPKVLQYVAPAALFLILVLTIFPWTGVYPGGVAQDTQNAWQATLGWYTPDPDIHGSTLEKDTQPGWNVLLIFYLLLFFPTFLVTAGCLALSFVPPAKLWPAVYPVLPWRWGIVAALNLILLMFLALQLVLGFSLENKAIGAFEAEMAEAAKARAGKPPSTEEARQESIARGVIHQGISRTIFLDLVVLFHLLAVAGAGLTFWVQRRGGRPAPRIDLLT